MKHTSADKKALSYDIQDIEPVAPVNVVRRYGSKEDGISHTSAKDSAYGSMEVKVNKTYKNNYKQTMILETNNSPSRSLSATSIHQDRSPLTAHAQRFQRSEEVFSKELESLKGSSSTLHSLGNSSNSRQTPKSNSFDNPSVTSNDVPIQIVSSCLANKPVITQNGFSPGTNSNKANKPSYVSMKSTVYDNVTARSETNATVD